MESEIRRTFLIAVIFNLSKNLKVLELKKIKKIKKMVPMLLYLSSSYTELALLLLLKCKIFAIWLVKTDNFNIYSANFNETQESNLNLYLNKF